MKTIKQIALPNETYEVGMLSKFAVLYAADLWNIQNKAANTQWSFPINMFGNQAELQSLLDNYSAYKHIILYVYDKSTVPQRPSMIVQVDSTDVTNYDATKTLAFQGQVISGAIGVYNDIVVIPDGSNKCRITIRYDENGQVTSCEGSFTYNIGRASDTHTILQYTKQAADSTFVKNATYTSKISELEARLSALEGNE